jgi:uncharacterized protein (TIGR04222 family)
LHQDTQEVEMQVTISQALGGPGDTWGTWGTWGISGSAFLLLYLALAAAVWIAGAQARRSIRGTPLTRPGVDPQQRPYDLALLNGGRRLALDAALVGMHRAGTLVPKRGRVQANGRLDAGADPLERAVHATALTPVARARLQHNRSVERALDTVQERLVTGGLLLSDPDRRRYRAVGWWMLGVACLGLVRLLAGVAAAMPVGFLLAALVAVTVVGIVQLVRVPLRTRAGERVLISLRSEHHVLAPSMKPDWAAYGTGAAVLGVALFGTSALWASDPVFADELEVEKASAAGSGVGWSGGTSGCGSSGGDSGGGGGCGGGGGGCGG